MSDKEKAECPACDYDSCVASCKDKAAVIVQLRQSLELAESDCKTTATISAQRLEKMDALKTEADQQRQFKEASDHVGAGWQREAETAQARIAKLDNALRQIAHVDKTPPYGYTGQQADKDRRGQIPKKPGERWKTPREIVAGVLGEEKAPS